MAKKSYKEHIDEIGEEKYWRAYDRAMMECKLNSRFVGLDKIRQAISHEAALQATGFDARPFALPKRCGEASIEMQAACENMLAKAIEAAQQS